MAHSLRKKKTRLKLSYLVYKIRPPFWGHVFLFLVKVLTTRPLINFKGGVRGNSYFC